MTSSSVCLGSILAELPFDSQQQQSVLDLLAITDTALPPATDQECSNQETLEWLVQTTQTEFFTRTNERYGLKIPRWIEDNQDHIIEILSNAGFTAAVPLTDSKVDCLAILGATGTEIKKRMIFTKDVLNTTIIPHVFLLTGERYSVQGCSEVQLAQNQNCGFIGPDGGYEYLSNLAEHNHKTLSQITETDIMLDQYNKVVGNNNTAISLHVVDTPKGEKVRPDTVATVIHFIRSPEFEKCHHTAFVSRAPNIKAQHLSIRKVYREQGLVQTFETIGGSANVTELKTKASAAHHILMPIAGVIYDSYTEICKKLSQDKEQCTEQYRAAQLSFKSLEEKARLSKKPLEIPADKDL
jgi:hypothetical protein